MTISKTPRTDYRHAYRDPTTHRFAARPDSAVTRLPTPPIGRMPRTPDGLSADAWPDIATQAVDMPAPPHPWPARVNEEPVERETWGPVLNWRDIAIGALVAIVGGVFVAGASLALTGAVFGFDPVQVAADIRGVLGQ
jgi:hypothetical protein